MLTACQKIKCEILMQALKSFKADGELSEKEQEFVKITETGITEETVDEQYDALVETKNHWDFVSEFREGQVETKLPSEYSRHYEAKEVARQLSDGSWVGWTYWYGGGKHGTPEDVEWMEDAYDLDVTETEKVIVVQEFKKITSQT